MSYTEAKEDGIEYDKGWYKIPCHSCRIRYVRSTAYSRKRKYTCDICKCIAKGKEEPEHMFEKEVRFRKAVSKMEVLVKDIKEYQTAIETVHKSLFHKRYYKSTEEIMTAIELVHRGVKTIHQQKIGKYYVDFVLPEYKVLLEIDGKPYHNNHTLEKEALRDSTILLTMGAGWEMIRVDTDKINKDITKLLPAIEEILEYRRLN